MSKSSIHTITLSAVVSNAAEGESVVRAHVRKARKTPEAGRTPEEIEAAAPAQAPRTGRTQKTPEEIEAARRRAAAEWLTPEELAGIEARRAARDYAHGYKMAMDAWGKPGCIPLAQTVVAGLDDVTPMEAGFLRAMADTFGQWPAAAR